MMTIKGTNELRFNRATMQEIVEYYLRNKMFSTLGVGLVRVTDVEWLDSESVFNVMYAPVLEGKKKA